MPTIRIEKSLLGLAPHYQSSTAAFEGKNHEYSRTDGIDFSRPGFEGHITPAQIFNDTAVTSNINSLPRARVNDPSQATPATYVMLGGLSGVAPRWVHLAVGAYSTHGDVAAHGGHNFTTIPSGTGFWGEDVALYNVSGAKRVFISWSDNADGDVGIIDTASDTPTYDFMSTVPTGAAALTANVPHRIVEGGDGKLYITNGRYLMQYDGASNTCIPTKRDAGAGWMIVDIRPWKDFLIVVSIKIGDAYRPSDYAVRSRVAFWDYVQDGLGVVYDIPDPLSSACFIDEDVPYLFTQGKNGTGKIRRFNGSKFVVMKQWSSGLYGTIPQPNAIDSYHGQIVWAPADSLGGYIMAYSPLYDALHVPYFANDGSHDATTLGMVSNIFEGTLNVGMYVAGSYKLAAGSGASGYASLKNFRTLVYRLPFKAKITKIRAYFSQMKSGSSATFSLFKNYTAQQVGVAGVDQLKTKRQTVSYSSDGELSEFEILPTILKCSAFYMNILATGQISIPLIEVDYEPYGSGQ